jgi:hypothetical protein
MKLGRLIKMSLNETCCKTQTGKHLSDSFPIQKGLKQDDAFRLFWRIRCYESPTKQGGNETSWNISASGICWRFLFTGRTHAYYKEKPMSVVAKKEVCLKVYVERLIIWPYIASRMQNKITAKRYEIARSFEYVAKFRYLGPTLTNQYSMHEQITSILNS